MTLDQMIPAGAERGAGLILQYADRYLFFLAGSRYRAETSTFFAGIGGHLEAGESWLDCLHREAIEELGAPVTVLDSERFYRITPDDHVVPGELSPMAVQPRPVALVEITIPANVSWNPSGRAHPYFVAVFRGRLSREQSLIPDDIDGLLLLPADLVSESLDGGMTLEELLARGAARVEKVPSPPRLTIYPFGSARAMALLLRAGEPF